MQRLASAVGRFAGSRRSWRGAGCPLAGAGRRVPGFLRRARCWRPGFQSGVTRAVVCRHSVPPWGDGRFAAKAEHGHFQAVARVAKPMAASIVPDWRTRPSATAR